MSSNSLPCASDGNHATSGAGALLVAIALLDGCYAQADPHR